MLTTSKVRKATADDEEELMVMCRELHRENGILKLDEGKVREFLRRALAPNGGAIIGALGPPGQIQGSIYLLISSFWYSSDWTLEELWSFVLPQYRKSNNAIELIEFAKRCSDELNIPLFIGVVSNERTEAKVKLYQRRLQKPAGAFFFYHQQSIATG